MLFCVKKKIKDHILHSVIVKSTDNHIKCQSDKSKGVLVKRILVSRTIQSEFVVIYIKLVMHYYCSGVVAINN